MRAIYISKAILISKKCFKELNICLLLQKPSIIEIAGILMHLTKNRLALFGAKSITCFSFPNTNSKVSS